MIAAVLKIYCGVFAVSVGIGLMTHLQLPAVLSPSLGYRVGALAAVCVVFTLGIVLVVLGAKGLWQL